ncbi:unnamed protein product [Rotaria socialis]|uniref:Uncharacterized protein n=1 Tax=Rotaria socialis TaxID=392032 RepID=A0A818VZG7_9BILA|nr:unnamed protein product [Rotaria socialis]CAF4729140.1 unnamed protein product [Rotaria socialis]
MEECLNEYSETADDCLKLLRELVNDIKAHHKRCFVVKTAGTAVSISGSAVAIGCIIATPFTGGVSLFALAGFGAATAATGAATNAGTDVVDGIWTTKYCAKLAEIDIRRKCVAKRLVHYLNQIEAEDGRIFRKNGNEKDALIDAFDLFVRTNLKLPRQQ